MKLTKRNIKLAWKYRGLLWKYRHAIRRRRQIAGMAAAAGAAVGLCMVVWRRMGRSPVSTVGAQ